MEMAHRGLCDLPDEILLHIFAYLPAASLFGLERCASRFCRILRSSTARHRVWNGVLAFEFPLAESGGPSHTDAPADCVEREDDDARSLVRMRCLQRDNVRHLRASSVHVIRAHRNLITAVCVLVRYPGSIPTLRRRRRSVSTSASSGGEDIAEGDSRPKRASPACTRFVATSSADCSVRVWDVQLQDCCVCILQGHTNSISSLHWNPHAALLVSGGWDRRALWWDLAGILYTPKRTHRSSSREYPVESAIPVIQALECAVLPGHTRAVTCLASSHACDVVVGGGGDGVILAWVLPPSSRSFARAQALARAADPNPDRAAATHSSDAPPPARASCGTPSCHAILAVSLDDRGVGDRRHVTAVDAAGNGTLFALHVVPHSKRTGADAVSIESLRTFKLFPHRVRCVSFAGASQYFGVGEADGRVMLAGVDVPALVSEAVCDRAAVLLAVGPSQSHAAAVAEPLGLGHRDGAASLSLRRSGARSTRLCYAVCAKAGGDTAVEARMLGEQPDAAVLGSVRVPVQATVMTCGQDVMIVGGSDGRVAIVSFPAQRTAGNVPFGTESVVRARLRAGLSPLWRLSKRTRALALGFMAALLIGHVLALVCRDATPAATVAAATACAVIALRLS